ncbi:MAG: hypothetical protein R2746_13170 [Acidimicrobiales bacterium]|nr:hypothetical protein [Actinomycetota bacterium]
MAAGHDAHDDHGHDAHGHDDHGHGGHDDHGHDHPEPTGDAWVVPPIAIGLVIGIVLVVIFGLESGAAAFVH